MQVSKRAIVIGDDLVDTSDDKIKSFVSVKADAKAGNMFAKTYTPKSGESRHTAILNARDLIGLRATFISSQSVDIHCLER